MFYYAYLNADDICTQIYAMPAPITGSQFIAISNNDTTLIGQHFNRTTSEFEAVYYYAIIDDRNIVTSVTYSTTQQATTATVLPITFAQYQSVLGMYWNGTAFVEPPISALAVASTDEVNYKNQEKWLSTKLDEMDTAISGNASNISTLSTDLSTIATSLATVANSVSALVTVVDGKANASHTHTAADISGVVKSVNGNTPDENGNINITNSGMTANEILASLSTVDGTGSGLDADTLDGLDSTAFALANHTHDNYLTASALGYYVTTAAMNTALTSKADAVHTHTMENVTGLATALAGKSDSTHNHDNVYATSASVTALGNTVSSLETAVEDVENALNEKSDAEHTHTGYATTAELNAISAALNNKANTSHTHSISDVTGLQSALNGKADEDHTHNDYLPTSGGSVSGNLNVGGILRVNNQQAVYDSGSMVTLSTNNRETMIAGSKIYSKVQISVSSDERLKAAISNVPEKKMIDFVKGLKVKEYNYLGSDEKCIGVIAQDVQKTDLADYYIREDEDGYLSVKTTDLVFPLIVAVQELYRKIEK